MTKRFGSLLCGRAVINFVRHCEMKTYKQRFFSFIWVKFQNGVVIFTLVFLVVDDEYILSMNFIGRNSSPSVKIFPNVD